MAKELARSSSDKMLAGVCGGLGAYTGITPVIIRIIFGFGLFGGLVLAGVPTGIFIVAYIVLWVAMPSKPKTVSGSTAHLNCDKPNCGYAYSAAQGDAFCRTCAKRLSDVLTVN